MATPGRSKKNKTHHQTRSPYWSAAVTKHSNALDLEKSVFGKKRPREIALSLKRSAEASKRRKGTPLQSAMSMLNFYMNRAGRNLSEARIRVLERAKSELRTIFKRYKGQAHVRAANERARTEGDK
jgi:hypothetical protein